jgi:hypothetical protein
MVIFRNLALIAFWLIVLSHGHAARADLTGNQLWGMCERERPVCFGHIWGAVEMMVSNGALYRAAIGESPNNPENRYLSAAAVCPPKGVTPSQAIDVVILWLQNHPERRHEYAAVVVLAALSRDWMCD